MVFCKLLTLLIVVYITGGSFGFEVRSAIVGRKDAGKGAWPWMVYFNITSKERKFWGCGGTIVSNQWVLSAAHCWDRSLWVYVWKAVAYIGAHALEEPAHRYLGIHHVTLHDGYKKLSNGYMNDIAMVKLEERLTFKPGVVEKVVWATDIPYNSNCWIVGWGNTGKNDPLPEPRTLQQVEMSIIPHSTCKQAHPELPSGMMCAKSDAGGEDAGGKIGPCKGDYGGPLMCCVAGHLRQVGIISYWGADQCGGNGGPSLYTPVSKYKDFIEGKIKGGD